jgi:hypothetical protein
MMQSERFAYRGSLLALLAIFVGVLTVGLIGERIGPNGNNSDKAEGFIADMQAVATQAPRLPDGSVVRQGALSTAWLDDVGALPSRLEAMAGSLRGAEDQRTLGLVRRGPWSFIFAMEARDSLVWITLNGIPKAVCDQIALAIARHPDQVAYVSAFGDPPITPGVLSPTRLCAMNFNNSAVIMLDPPTEVRRLSADIQHALAALTANPTDKLAMSGSAAPFQVDKGQDGGPGFIQRDRSGIRVTINNVPLSVCRLALLTGPKAFGMEAFEGPDGKTASPRTRPASDKLCNDMRGRLVLSRG